MKDPGAILNRFRRIPESGNCSLAWSSAIVKETIPLCVTADSGTGRGRVTLARRRAGTWLCVLGIAATIHLGAPSDGPTAVGGLRPGWVIGGRAKRC